MARARTWQRWTIPWEPSALRRITVGTRASYLLPWMSGFFWKFGIRRHVTFLKRYPSFASRDAGNLPRGGNDLDIQKLADTAPQGKAGCELVGGIRVDGPQRLARPAGRAIQQKQLGCPEVWDSAAPLQLGFVGRCHLSQLGNAS